MKLSLFTIIAITAAMISTTILGHLGTLPTTYALSPIEDAKLMDDILSRLVSIDGITYTIKCPTFSELDEFTIDMKITEVSREYYENYERIMCNGMTPTEIMEESESKMEDMTEKLKQ